MVLAVLVGSYTPATAFAAAPDPFVVIAAGVDLGAEDAAVLRKLARVPVSVVTSCGQSLFPVEINTWVVFGYALTTHASEECERTYLSMIRFYGA